jgi:hypothetical protein
MQRIQLKHGPPPRRRHERQASQDQLGVSRLCAVYPALQELGIRESDRNWRPKVMKGLGRYRLGPAVVRSVC